MCRLNKTKAGVASVPTHIERRVYLRGRGEKRESKTGCFGHLANATRGVPAELADRESDPFGCPRGYDLSRCPDYRSTRARRKSR